MICRRRSAACTAGGAPGRAPPRGPRAPWRPRRRRCRGAGRPPRPPGWRSPAPARRPPCGSEGAAAPGQCRVGTACWAPPATRTQDCSQSRGGNEAEQRRDALGEDEGQARDVRMALQPELGARGPARHHHLARAVPVGAHRLQHRLRAVAHRLHQRPEHVAPPVLEGQPRHRPARQRVGVRRAVALEVVQADHALAPGRDRRRLGVELLVRGPPRQALEPGHGGAGGGLPPLHHVDPGEHGVGVGAPHARPVEPATDSQAARRRLRARCARGSEREAGAQPAARQPATTGGGGGGGALTCGRCSPGAGG